MRINGFEQLRAFYSWVFNNQDKNIKSQHISLYVFLLNQNNRNNWVEWFKCPFDLGMTGSAIGNKKTYYNCLKDLQEWKLIKYKKGINEWKAPVIKIEVLKSTSTDTATVPQGEPLPTPLHTPLHTHIDKPITYNLKHKTDKGGIPDFEEFKNYALSKEENVNLAALKLKYDSWVENGWNNGNGKAIKNWKSTLLNTLPYIPKDKKQAPLGTPQNPIYTGR